MNDLMMDMMMEDDKATILLDRLTEHSSRTAAMYARTGHDIIGLGDDVGMQSSLMMSGELWRRWLKPRLAAVIDTIKSIKPDALVLYHSCGFIEPFIGDLIEVGVDILNPVQPLARGMNPDELKKEFGDRITFNGGILCRLQPMWLSLRCPGRIWKHTAEQCCVKDSG